MPSPVRTLRSGFLRALERFPDRPAVCLGDAQRSYRELHTLAARIAATLQCHLPHAEPRFTAVLGQASFTAFAGVLAALLRGHGYVPLDPAYPAARTRDMLRRSEAAGLVVGPDGLALMPALLDEASAAMVVVLPETADVTALARRWPGHRFIGADDLADAATARLEPVDPGDVAYLLFTSGSTGQPKGVLVAQRTVTHFVDCVVDRYGVTEQDRFSHTFSLCFDLSVFDLFVAWERGACVVCPTAAEKLFPAEYIGRHRISIWFSVPSTAVVMQKLRKLGPDSQPSLRWSLFCGEGLPAKVARAWQCAAPGAIIENLYGPTELTIACTYYRWRGDDSLPECELGLVPIGEPFPGMETLVVDEALEAVSSGQAGELLMSGPQLGLGYWRDGERTQAAFVVPPGRDRVYYRTGDRVRRTPGPGLVFLGRIDDQLKIRGYRVEPGEIEAVVRQEAGVEIAVAVGHPRTASGADGIVVFVSEPLVAPDEMQQRLRQRLPPWMQPKEICHVPSFPLNSNGKIDRRALLAQLEARVLADR